MLAGLKKIGSSVSAKAPLAGLKTAGTAAGSKGGLLGSLKGAATGIVKKGPLGAASTLSASKLAQQAQDKAVGAAAEQALGLSGDQAKTFQTLTGKAGGTSAAFSSVKTFFTQTIPTAASDAGTWMKVGLAGPFMSAEIPVGWGQIIGAYLIVMLAIAIPILLWAWWTGRLTPSTATDPSLVANTLNATTAAKKEGFQDAAAAAKEPSTVDPGDTKFVDLQPLTIKQAGYLGPAKGGKFDPEQATGNALRAGFRAFVLQIDYLKTEKDKANFPDVGIPTLLYRDDTGALVSANSGSLEKVTQTIASLAFRPESPKYTMPVILYLHVVRAPSPIREAQAYLRFLSQIARALKPIAPFHLGSTPLGVFNRQKQEKQLLMTPLKAIEGQVVILSNVDTTLFRTPSPDGLRINPADDLDYFVNMRVYLNSDDESIGLTKTPEKEGGAAAVVVMLDDYVKLSAGKKDAFATKGKGRFVVALPSQEKNPEPKVLESALTELGANLVPLDIFGEELVKTQVLLKTYSNESYHAKPLALRTASS